MPWRVAERDGRGERTAPPIAIIQPVRASLRRRRLATAIADPADEREADQPAGLAAERLVRAAATGRWRRRRRRRRRRPGRPRRRRDRRPGRRGGRGRCSRGSATRSVVARARDPRAVGRGVSATSSGQIAADDDHRGDAREQLAQRRDVAARGDPQPRGGDAGHDQQRSAPSSPRSRARPSRRRARASACGRPRSARTTDQSAATRAEHEQRVGVVVAGDRDRDRRDREREAGDEAADAAEAAARRGPR